MSSRMLVERKLVQVASRLREMRAELGIVDEQLAFFAEAADDARLRALVSETPIADREHVEAQKHADALARQRAAVAASIAELERARDDLLDRLGSEGR